MATKAANLLPANGMHTAGIYSDMTVDGPEIGTLVVVFDRAKNLPNRKTMGKQDPYCAARLGKEAKKTETDVRGGQTPRWCVEQADEHLGSILTWAKGPGSSLYCTRLPRLQQHKGLCLQRRQKDGSDWRDVD